MFKRLGKMDVAVDKLHFRNHVDSSYKANCNPHDRNELHGVSVILSVCPLVQRYRFAFLVLVFVFCFGGGGVVRT